MTPAQIFDILEAHDDFERLEARSVECLAALLIREREAGSTDDPEIDVHAAVKGLIEAYKARRAAGGRPVPELDEQLRIEGHKARVAAYLRPYRDLQDLN